MLTIAAILHTKEQSSLLNSAFFSGLNLFATFYHQGTLTVVDSGPPHVSKVRFKVRLNVIMEL